MKRQNSKAIGNCFEDLFLKLCRLQGIAITRVPDGCRVIGNDRMVKIKSPFDWVISWSGLSAMIDTKTVQGKSFPHSLITDHQALELLNHERVGAKAGYVVWLRSVDSVIFIPASHLCRSLSIRGSISDSDSHVLRLGSIGPLNVRELFYGVLPPRDGY